MTTTRLTWLRNASQSPAPTNILGLIERVEFLRELGIDRERQQAIPASAFDRIAREALNISAQHFAEAVAPRRHALLTTRAANPFAASGLVGNSEHIKAAPNFFRQNHFLRFGISTHSTVQVPARLTMRLLLKKYVAQAAAVSLRFRRADFRNLRARGRHTAIGIRLVRSAPS